MKKLFIALPLFLNGACLSDTPPESGTPDAGIAGNNSDAGGSGQQMMSWTGPASRSASGVLTNRPMINFSGSGDLEITSAFLIIHRGSSFDSVQAWGDVENKTSVTQCVPLIDLTIGGVEIIAVVDGPAYRLSESGVTSACLTPGAKGAFKAIKNEVPATLIDGSASFTYSITGLQAADAERHADEPEVVRATIGEVEGGFGVRGELMTSANVIHNFGVGIYARDVSGLLFDDTSAFPGDLMNLPTSARLEFETYPVKKGGVTEPAITGPFPGYELYMSFIEGPSRLRFEDGPWAERFDTSARRRVEFQDARRALEQL